MDTLTSRIRRRIARAATDWARFRARFLPASVKQQVRAFEHIWEGGYFSGDVTDPQGDGAKSDDAQGVKYFDIYQRCVVPFVSAEASIVEIGPGRGSWTKGFLPCREVWVLEAQSLESNSILQYLGHPTNLRYVQVNDFSCRDLPEGHFDFLFSYGTLCHISMDGIRQYMANLHGKMKPGAQGMVMISDWTKHPAYRHLSVDNYTDRWLPPGTPIAQTDQAGYWVPNNGPRMRQLLAETGWDVLDDDVLHCKKDTIMHIARRG